MLRNALTIQSLLLLVSCSSPVSGPIADSTTPTVDSNPNDLADVSTVSVSGSPGAYTVAVTIASPDLGCDQYANWWEIVTPAGDLVARRILGHSHVGEQPFTRSGSAPTLTADAEVIVRAHMHPQGYGGQAMRGSVSGGFVIDASIAASFAPTLATTPPLPDGCAF